MEELPLHLPIGERAHGSGRTLQIAFGVGVWKSAGQKRVLRFSGASLVGVGLVGFVTGLFSPMHMREDLRGAERKLTDTMHLVLTGVLVLLIQFAVGFGATAFGQRFRRYSIGTILTMLAGGSTAAAARRVEARLPYAVGRHQRAHQHLQLPAVGLDAGRLTARGRR